MAKEIIAREEVRRPESGCILKIKTGRSFRGLVAYQAERGTDMNGAITQSPLYTNMLGQTPRELSREMALIRRLRPGLNTAVGHLQICPSRSLKTKKEWIEAVQIAFDAHGIHDAPFVCYLHSEGDGKTNHAHLHIAFSRIRFDGSVISDSSSYRKNELAARKIEDRFQLGAIKERPKEKRPYDNRKAFDSLRREDRLTEKSKEKSSGGVTTKRSVESKGPKKMATKENIEKMAAAVERAMQRATSDDEFRERLEKDLEGQGIARYVNFVRRGGENEIYGYSLVADIGSGGVGAIKASELGRHLSWPKVAVQIAENQDRARRARMRRAGDDADAMVTTSEAIARAAKGAVPRLAGVATFQASASARVQPTPRAPGAKPDLSALLGQGVQLPGYQATRTECLDAATSIWRWEYRRTGSDDLCFVDAGESLEIYDDALANPEDIDAFLRAAAARFGNRLTLTDAPAKGDGEFLDLLAQAAERHGVEIIDGRTGLPVGAAERHKEPSQPVSGGLIVHDAEQEQIHALEDLGAHYESELAELDELEALGLGVPMPAVLAVAAGVDGAKAAALVGVAAVPQQNDFEARRLRALEVKAIAEALPARFPTQADAGLMSAAQLSAVHAAFSKLEPVRDWAVVTAQRHEQERFLGQGDAAALVLQAAERKARMAGKPLPTETARLAEADARKKLAAAQASYQGMGFAAKAAEAVSGRRAAEMEEMEEVVKSAQRASLRAHREFSQTEEAKLAAAEMAVRQSTYWAEREALGAPWVEHLASSLARMLSRLAGWLTTALRREIQDEQARRDREQLIEDAREAAADCGSGSAVGDDQERAQARRELGRGG